MRPNRELTGRLRKFALGLGLGLLFPLAAVQDGLAADKVAGVLSLRDALTSPGKPARLEARLVGAGLFGQGGLGGEQIEFTVDGRPAGTAMTGGDGRAFLEYTPRMRGNQPVAAKLAPNKRVESQEAKGTLFSWERRRPILLVELAVLEAASPSSPLPIPSLPLGGGPGVSLSAPSPVPDAAEELKRLTDYFYNVIYLARSGRRDLSGHDDVREWLRQHHFPPGLVLALADGTPALATKLDELKAEGWDNLKAGIGRSRAFAEALAERRMPVIIMPASDRDAQGLPKKARVMKQWKEVRQKLQG